jgi:hypothetical protein
MSPPEANWGWSCSGLCFNLNQLKNFHLNYSAFSSTAHIVSELKVISDMKIRQEMMKKVPKDLYSITCIGCGLDLAVQVRASIQIKSY